MEEVVIEYNRINTPQDHSLQVASEMYSNALYYLQINQPEIAVQYLKSAAFNNHPAAQYEYGRCYELGLGVERNQERAFKWYQRAESHGYEWGSTLRDYSENDTLIIDEPLSVNVNESDALSLKEKEHAARQASLEFIIKNSYPLRNFILHILEENLFSVIDEVVKLLVSRDDAIIFSTFFCAFICYQEASNEEQLASACKKLIYCASDLVFLTTFLELAILHNKLSAIFTDEDIDEAYRICDQDSTKESLAIHLRNHGLFATNRDGYEDSFSSEEVIQPIDSESSHTSDMSRREERLYLKTLIESDQDDADDSYEFDYTSSLQPECKQ